MMNSMKEAIAQRRIVIPRSTLPVSGKVGCLLLVIWLASGMVAILVPHSKWAVSKDEFYQMYGQYIEYELQQEQANRNNNNNNNQDDDGNNNYNVPTGECKWYNWGCRKAIYAYMEYNENQDNNGDNNDAAKIRLPTWYRFLGGTTEEDRRFYEEQGWVQSSGEANGATKFVHIWMMIMFIGLMVFGSITIYRNRPGWGLIIALAMFAQFSIMQLVLLGQGVILTDDRDLEESIYGFYGQMPMLMAYQNWGYFWFSVVFCVLFFLKNTYFLVFPNSSLSLNPNNNNSTVASTAPADANKEYKDVEDAKNYKAQEDNYEAPAVYNNSNSQYGEM